ncbi:hypothetical protein NA56DRAFT_752224 [Hyaloscypha hepaticicola]|uniref:Uncharacterized protein n=1 Tax=Hyaloscypha hepaticicola TaxID=2082293 RepID=A0A2J6PU61_9HELO|nr:hypothetical protein NA56DRAFT_752224 [Hyaloscypha hepaticicola]
MGILAHNESSFKSAAPSQCSYPDQLEPLVLALHPDSSVSKGAFSTGTGLGFPALSCEAVKYGKSLTIIRSVRRNITPLRMYYVAMDWPMPRESVESFSASRRWMRKPNYGVLRVPETVFPRQKHDTLASNSGIEGTFWSQIVPTYGSLFIPKTKGDPNENMRDTYCFISVQGLLLVMKGGPMPLPPDEKHQSYFIDRVIRDEFSGDEPLQIGLFSWRISRGIAAVGRDSATYRLSVFEWDVNTKPRSGVGIGSCDWPKGELRVQSHESSGLREEPSLRSRVSAAATAEGGSSGSRPWQWQWGMCVFLRAPVFTRATEQLVAPSRDSQQNELASSNPSSVRPTPQALAVKSLRSSRTPVFFPSLSALHLVAFFPPTTFTLFLLLHLHLHLSTFLLLLFRRYCTYLRREHNLPPEEPGPTITCPAIPNTAAVLSNSRPDVAQFRLDDETATFDNHIRHSIPGHDKYSIAKHIFDFELSILVLGQQLSSPSFRNCHKLACV